MNINIAPLSNVFSMQQSNIISKRSPRVISNTQNSDLGFNDLSFKKDKFPKSPKFAHRGVFLSSKVGRSKSPSQLLSGTDVQTLIQQNSDKNQVEMINNSRDSLGNVKGSLDFGAENPLVLVTDMNNEAATNSFGKPPSVLQELKNMEELSKTLSKEETLIKT